MGFRFGTRRAFPYLVGASLLAASVVLAACSEETEKSGKFKLRPVVLNATTAGHGMQWLVWQAWT